MHRQGIEPLTVYTQLEWQLGPNPGPSDHCQGVVTTVPLPPQLLGIIVSWTFLNIRGMDRGGLLGVKVVGWLLCAKMIEGLMFGTGVVAGWMLGAKGSWAFLKNV